MLFRYKYRTDIVVSSPIQFFREITLSTVKPPIFFDDLGGFFYLAFFLTRDTRKAVSPTTADRDETVSMP